MPPPSCVSLFNAVCNTFNLPPLPPFLCVHPSLVQLSRREGGREGLSSCSWRHACLHCLRDTRVHAYVALSMTMHLFFVVLFFFFSRFIFTSFPPSFLCKYPARSYFCFSSPPPRWKIKCEEGGGDFNRLNRVSRRGQGERG